MHLCGSQLNNHMPSTLDATHIPTSGLFPDFWVMTRARVLTHRHVETPLTCQCKVRFLFAAGLACGAVNLLAFALAPSFRVTVECWWWRALSTNSGGKILTPLHAPKYGFTIVKMRSVANRIVETRLHQKILCPNFMFFKVSFSFKMKFIPDMLNIHTASPMFFHAGCVTACVGKDIVTAFWLWVAFLDFFLCKIAPRGCGLDTEMMHRTHHVVCGCAVPKGLPRAIEELSLSQEFIYFKVCCDWWIQSHDPVSRNLHKDRQIDRLDRWIGQKIDRWMDRHRDSTGVWSAKHPTLDL